MSERVFPSISEFVTLFKVEFCFLRSAGKSKALHFFTHTFWIFIRLKMINFEHLMINSWNVFLFNYTECPWEKNSWYLPFINFINTVVRIYASYVCPEVRDIKFNSIKRKFCGNFLLYNEKNGRVLTAPKSNTNFSRSLGSILSPSACFQL